jgi:formate hydrogenlyase transcriptional activator
MREQIESIPAAAMRKLSSWHWPGNIRELENFVERSLILTHGMALQPPMAEMSNNGRNATVVGTHDADLTHEEVGHRPAQRKAEIKSLLDGRHRAFKRTTTGHRERSWAYVAIAAIRALWR